MNKDDIIDCLTKENKKLKEENEKLKEELKKYESKKGQNCSISGNNYEIAIHNIIKSTYLNNKPFNTQKIEDLGGSTSSNDLECNFNDNVIGIEVKIAKAPDWMQCSLKRCDNKWIGSEKGKIPEKARLEFNKFIQKLTLFDGNIPPFLEKKLTHKEWKDINSASHKFDDIYIDIPDDTINKIYLAKNCKYIQISHYGLYRLADDVCNFDVPLFKVKQKLRVRIKIHQKKNSEGFCNMSVIASCLPCDISTLEPSLYSLDNIEKLPKNLKYKTNKEIEV
jgi:hypothetical protein